MVLERVALLSGRLPAARVPEGGAPRVGRRRRPGGLAQPAPRQAGPGGFQGQEGSQPAVEARGPAGRRPVGAGHGRPQVGDEAAALQEPPQLPLVRLPRRLRAPRVVRCKKLSGGFSVPS